MNRFSYNNYPDIGAKGEELVAKWLQSTGWIILHQRWSCRWGEIDIVALQQKDGEEIKIKLEDSELESKSEPNQKNREYPIHKLENSRANPDDSVLAFVEVKTRSRGSWDAGGRNAINRKKQGKIWRTAQIYLAQNSDLADLPCRFDVAIVQFQPKPNQHTVKKIIGKEVLASLSTQEYQFNLEEYIPGAFDLNIDDMSGNK